MTHPASIDGGDVLIVGACLAGVCAALHVPSRCKTLLSHRTLGKGCASAWVQSGIAAACDAEDHVRSHALDTIVAGADIVDGRSAHWLRENILEVVQELAGLGAPFDRDRYACFALGREAGHSRSRIVRVSGDGAGGPIMTHLVAALRRLEHVRVLEGMEVRELLLIDGHVVGRAAQKTDSSETFRIRAKRVVLASGGAGQLYRFTTNPFTSRGEGITMANRAGAVLADTELVQFHPTAVFAGADPLPLTTEALRGEAASLRDRHGARFLRRVHPLGELAPRDVVARSITRERRHGPVFFETRVAIGNRRPERFPGAYNACIRAGIDPLRYPMPFMPATHYHLGGIAISDKGRSSLPGLWSRGEIASSGCHGANRLAGNSLGEALVFAKRVARDMDSQDFIFLGKPLAKNVESVGNAEDVMPLREMMTKFVGIESDVAGLRFACTKLLNWQRQSRPEARWANIATATLLIAAAALERRESRRCHFRLDVSYNFSLPHRRSRVTLAQAEEITAQSATSWPSPEQPIFP